MTAPQPSQLVKLGSDTYVIEVSSVAEVAFDGHIPEGPKPVTLLNLYDVVPTKIDAEWLSGRTQSMLAEDDVYNSHFQSHVLLNAVTDGKERISDDIATGQLGNLSCVSLEKSVRLPDGPYFMLGRSLHRCSRLYPDYCGAFMFGVTQDDTESSVYHKFEGPGIPVPSRLYSGKSSAISPLAGKRFAVKDILDVQGLPTSASCKAFASMHDITSPTAPVIAKLLSLGAVLVGKTKTSQFASGECAIDWVDYQCPFNVRGDGTFAPYCSSTGSASAIAAYDWLDVAIGSDTLGSIIQPASGHGVFGIRPTHGLSDMRGCLPVSKHLDTIGFLSRKLSDLRLFSKYTFGEKCSPHTNKFPTRTMLPPSTIHLLAHQKQQLVVDFIQERMEKRLGTKLCAFDFDVGWEKSFKTYKPASEHFKTTLAHIQLLGSYENNNAFRSAYKEKYGHEPYVNPMVRYKWNLGAQLSPTDVEKALVERSTLREYMRNKFGEEAICVMPANSPELEYRDDDYQRPFEERARRLQGFGFDYHQCSFLGGLPEIVVPIGQSSVLSKTTGKQTYKPFCVAIIGPPGSDLALMEMVEKLLPHAEVLTGETAFPIDSRFTC